MCGSDSRMHKVIGRRLNRSQGKFPRKQKGITVTVVRCSTCGLIYSDPQPIPFDIRDHYGLPPEEYWKDSYFTREPSYFQSEIETAKFLLKFKQGMRALDIGAGIGKAMIAMQNAGFETYGIEPSYPFYERAITQGVSKDRIRNLSIENINYPEDHFDFITFGAVLEHLYDPSEAIAAALRCLKPNGIVHIEVPSSKWLVGRIINLYYHITLSGFTGNISPMHVPFHMYEFALESFQLNSSRLGYSIAHHEYYVCETTLPRSFDFILKPIMKKSNTGMQLCVWLRKNG
jgi:2-polyprenyl-3-methyl-5-hydroxy-6-metoxy-1,4-benzoquinol methylase